jgi:hypothetical protein
MSKQPANVRLHSVPANDPRLYPDALGAKVVELDRLPIGLLVKYPNSIGCEWTANSLDGRFLSGAYETRNEALDYLVKAIGPTPY